MALINNLIIEASAGSGKTYQLAKRFINIFSQNPSKLSSIVAITFTNKASSEMKERIILFLKILSGIYKSKKIKKNDFNINNNEALNLLINIIKNHSDFNVTTIDSFMNRILKALSVDLNILPDYEVNFNTEEIFEIAINELLNDNENHEEFIKLLKSLLSLDHQGFNGEKIIKNYLKNYRNEDIPENIVTMDDILPKNINYLDFQEYINKQILNLSESLTTFIEKNSKILNGTKIKSFKNLNIDKIEKNIVKIKEILNDKNISKYCKKGKQLENRDEENFLNLLEEIYNIFKKFTIVKAVFKSSIVLNPLKKLIQLENDIKSKLNIVDWSQTNKIITKIINEKGVNYAYCKIGEYINHYLIDEFQDTSLDQFSAIKPLIENSISNAGTIFVVGDRKQAIYGWRGGDYKVFDRLKTILDKFNYEIVEINRNYRSYKNLVEFNNRVFHLDNLLNNLPEVDYIEELKNDIKIFKNSIQETMKDKDGYVNVILKNEDYIENKDEFYEENFNSIMQKVLNENKILPKNIMILLRRKDNIDKIVSWLREKYPDINFITEDSLYLLGNFEIKKLLLIILSLIKDYDSSYLLSLEEVEVKILEKDELKSKFKKLSPYEFVCYLIEKNYVDYNSSKPYFDVLLEKILELSKNNYSLEDIVDYFYENREISIKIPEGINAIKILTIHKAKGLEAHTVIVPFYDWDIGAKNIDDFITLKFENKQIFAKIKELKDIDDKIRKIYNMKRAMKFIEDLNLMYVANTRAIANLFIIGTYKDRKNLKMYNAGTFLWKLLNTENYEVGVIEKENEQIKDTNLEKQNPLKIKSNIRKFLRTYTELEEYNIFDENRKIGELFHTAMSFIGIIKDTQLEQTINNAYIKALKILKYENEKVKNLIKNCIEDLKEYFTNIDEYWNEKEIIDKNGNIYRIDRLVRIKENFIIIDYKTGDVIEESHSKQIKNYLKLFKNSRGILYYTKKRLTKFIN